MTGSTKADITVLAVGDEPELCQMFKWMLNDECKVETAENGEQALEKMREEIDVVLLDRRMPGMSGDGVLTEMRAGG